MAITRVSQSTVKEGLEKFTSALGGFVPVIGAYESIATVTVGSGGASSIEFTSIPGTYQHLQIRYVLRSNRSNALDNVKIEANGDTASNYTRHLLRGDGSSAGAFGEGSTVMNYQYATGANATSSVFGVGVVDLLDYASTSKTKTVRAFTGYDNNGSGIAALSSGLWNSTSAITSLKLVPEGTAWVQHSTAALYGIKAP